jgi:hypothetical protein
MGSMDRSLVAFGHRGDLPQDSIRAARILLRLQRESQHKAAVDFQTGQAAVLTGFNAQA